MEEDITFTLKCVCIGKKIYGVIPKDEFNLEEINGAWIISIKDKII